MATPSVAPNPTEAKSGTDLDYLEDRLGYLKRMLRGLGAALEAHHEAYGHTEHQPEDHTCCFFELLDAELERLEELAEELEGKAFTLKTGKAVA